MGIKTKTPQTTNQPTTQQPTNHKNESYIFHRFNRLRLRWQHLPGQSQE